MSTRFIQTLLLLTAAILIGALVTITLACPCGQIPGFGLAGEEATESVTDWSFANEAPLCQLEVDGGYPHSINLNCMSAKGELYVSCSRCEGKLWSGYAMRNPEARIRIQDRVYPVTLRRVTEAWELDGSWQARITKLGQDAASPRPEDWWTFHLASRRTD